MTEPKPKKINRFDIHFYYTKETQSSALKIREELKQRFPWLRFFNPHNQAMGPHPQPMWEADFYNSENLYADYGEVLFWLQLHHNGHSVLIHPKTGYPKREHTENALWLGERLPLKVETLTEIDPKWEIDTEEK
eukprot:TRINITY_DN12061_c0_g1_i1.p1 TRINITY_DN12061_c0_g1~~TRINITY_DN12061_c0_g1_i1.p1  ORF type:complete len:134 (+),score=21.73 TRINITY_DN12061_c0_g1_i1:90-491(+)